MSQNKPECPPFATRYCLTMFASDQYELIDFGDGRRLERFGDKIVDRPCPAAVGARKMKAEDWVRADFRFRRTGPAVGKWEALDKLSHFKTPQSKATQSAETRSPATHPPATQPWPIEIGSFRLELRPTEFGHVGVFPEQADNWRWITEQVRHATHPLRVLNLFGYTGAASLAAAAAGAEVTHVDAAKSTVSWARANALYSGLADRPVRWIAEDARKFTDRELRRGRQYDAVILDPPSYGHGSKGRPWKIEQHLTDLLTSCAELTLQNRAFLLLSCHTAQLGPHPLSTLVSQVVSHTSQSQIDASPLEISTVDGRSLNFGAVARWKN